jgi:hypothetical protein
MADDDPRLFFRFYNLVWRTEEIASQFQALLRECQSEADVWEAVAAIQILVIDKTQTQFERITGRRFREDVNWPIPAAWLHGQIDQRKRTLSEEEFLDFLITEILRRAPSPPAADPPPQKTGLQTTPEYIEGYQRIHLAGENAKDVKDELVQRLMDRGMRGEASDIRERLRKGIAHQRKIAEREKRRH